MFKIKSETCDYGINFPTSIKEITPEVLTSMTESVKLPKYHCVVALAFSTDLFQFAMTIDSKKETNVRVRPILAKISEEDSKTINAIVGDKIIVDRSNLERGHHLYFNSCISSDNARNYISKDEELCKKILRKEISADNIIILEFKIIPVNAIAAAIDNNVTVLDPFKSQELN